MKIYRDSFAQLLNDIGRVPLLTHEEEILLAREVQKWMPIRDLDSTGNKKLMRQQRRGQRAYNRFFQANLRMVVMVARKYTEVAKELQIEDLVMEGCVGLSRAIELFDPTRGYKFSTYAYNWIRQSITRSISYYDRSIRLPVNAIERLSKISKWLPEFQAMTGRFPKLAEIAEFCGCRLETLEACLAHRHRVSSLHQPALDFNSGNEVNGNYIQDVVADPGEVPMERLEADERAADIEALVRELKHEEAEVVLKRYGFLGECQRPIDQARELKVNKCHIWEREKRALKRLRVTLQAHREE